MLNVKLSKPLKAFYFKDDKDIDKLKDFFQEIGFEVLSIRKFDIEQEYTIYYIDKFFEAKDMNFRNDWYFILDQDECELSSCASDYFKDYYEEVK